MVLNEKACGELKNSSLLLFISGLVLLCWEHKLLSSLSHEQKVTFNTVEENWKVNQLALK